MFNKNRRNCCKHCCLFLLILIGFTSGVVPNHALYIGVIQIVHEEKEAVTTIQIKVFSDDLQSVLQNDIGYDQVPSIADLCASTSNPIETYFKNQLELKVNQELMDLSLVNCEQINDVHLLIFTSPQKKDWKTCSIHAPFFMELFPLQSNIINIKYNPINATSVQKMGRVSKGDGAFEFGF